MSHITGSVVLISFSMNFLAVADSHLQQPQPVASCINVDISVVIWVLFFSFCELLASPSASISTYLCFCHTSPLHILLFPIFCPIYSIAPLHVSRKYLSLASLTSSQCSARAVLLMYSFLTLSILVTPNKHLIVSGTIF